MGLVPCGRRFRDPLRTGVTPGNGRVLRVERSDFRRRIPLAIPTHWDRFSRNCRHRVRNISGYPYKFYRLSDDARALFDRNDLFPEAAWRRQYDRVRKPGRITELEEVPRPTR
ncbi:hypothetical protein [Halegenticoccus soli]|uniref:hypothetical protein n=1 Tax=Halegenticoccus soli TaxID=1985678 RepID=UPI001E3CC453|nr:hypothetical protein [Halegenticoccus soli]